MGCGAPANRQSKRRWVRPCTSNTVAQDCASLTLLCAIARYCRLPRGAAFSKYALAEPPLRSPWPQVFCNVCANSDENFAASVRASTSLGGPASLRIWGLSSHRNGRQGGPAPSSSRRRPCDIALSLQCACHRKALSHPRHDSQVDTLDIGEHPMYMFGRSLTCDFQLEHPSASRQHAVLVHGQDGASPLLVVVVLMFLGGLSW
eukprot:scaffold7906_cov30-Tisochrysis_lutea.AAC.3